MRIGVFDSGLGGLTVYGKIRERMPRYDYLYLGDNARAPYGDRSFETVLRFAREGVESLFRRGCLLVIIACNTASAKALRTLQQRWLPEKYPDRRVLGVIRPSAEALAKRPAGRVALWGTAGTVRSQSYVLELAKLAPELELRQTACPMLVPLVEAGELSGPGAEYFLKEYWAETTTSGSVDALLLACTHYPLLLPALRRLVPPETEILAQADIVAPSLEDYLRRHPEIESRLARGAAENFLTTDRSEGFDRLAGRFLGRPVAAERVEL